VNRNSTRSCRHPSAWPAGPDAAEWVQRLTKVALKDADGAELDGALRTVETLFEDA
jgi:hypothetical protein